MSARIPHAVETAEDMSILTLVIDDDDDIPFDENVEPISVRPFVFGIELEEELTALAELARVNGYSGLKLAFPHFAIEVSWGSELLLTSAAEDN